MRVSTTLIQQQGLQNILRKQADLLQVQTELSSGKKITKPSDDPSGASRVLDINEALAQITQYGENADYATQRLNLEETTLNSANIVLQRVRELSIQAANTGANNLQSQRAIASEMSEKLKELFDYANTKDENGDYIFSGFQSKTQAFTTDGAGNYFYNGDEGQLSLQIGSSRQVESSDSGAEVFQLIREGNGTFSVDANSTNGGAAKISTGSVVSPGVYQAQDFSIVFDEVTPATSPSTFTYNILNDTTGTQVNAAPIAYNDGGVIAFNGVEVEISGPPADRDVFTVNASRNQDVFTSLNNLVTSLETPGTGNVRGRIEGDFVNSGFDAGDTVGFDITFDGVTIPVSSGVIAGTETNVQLAQTMLTSIGTVTGATTNIDGSVTVQGNSTGKNITFKEVSGRIEFITSGGTSTNLNNVQINNLADTAANDAVINVTSSGSSIATQTTLNAATAGDNVNFLAGAPQTAQLSQQIDNAINNIDRAMDSIINVQTKIGGRINSIESQTSDNDSKELFLQTVRSDIEDLDFAEAISNFTFQTTALQVAQQTFVRVQGLSLFDLI